jgi:hypothetical protein
LAISKAVVAAIAVVVVLVTVVALYAGLTYPRTIVNIPVSFSIGADTTTVDFDQPALSNMVQVQVAIQNGVAGWRTRILSGDTEVWSDQAAQGGQQMYGSGWVAVPS